MKALLIDDDRSILALLHRVLERHGFEVQTYLDPTECPVYSATSCMTCAFARTGCPDLILSDVVMPYVNGVDFIAGIQRRGCKCPHMALMCGDWEDVYLQKASTLGVTLFTKPFRLRQFEEWLEDTVTGSSNAPVTGIGLASLAVNF